MKNKYTLITVLGLAVISLLSNSCKKDAQSSVESLLSRGQWQLASVIVFNYVGSTNTSNDTLNTTCSLNQTFTFNNDDKSCTYQDFACITQTAKGQWQLSDDKLSLQAPSLSCQDTLAGKNVVSTPFKNARIINLGQYSLVLETGDISTYYLSTDKRHVKRYGFVRY